MALTRPCREQRMLHGPVDADLRVVHVMPSAPAVRARGEVLDIDDVRQRAEAAREGPRCP